MNTKIKIFRNIFFTFAISVFFVFLTTTSSADSVLESVNVDFSQSRSLPYLSNDMVLFENVIVGDQRYAAIMQWHTSNVFELIWYGTLNKVEIPFHTITINGDDADWIGISPVVEDAAGDEHPDYAAVSGTDLANVYLARDNTYLYFLMTFYDGNPVDAAYAVELQQYLTQLHTPGDRIAVANNESGWTVSISDRVGFGDATLIYPADHVAVGTALIEWKVPIIGMQYPPDTPSPYFSPLPPPPGIENQFIRTYIHPHPHPSPVSDSNDELTRPMIVNFYE